MITYSAHPQKRRRGRSPLRVSWLLVLPGVAFALIGHFIAPVAGAFYAFTDWTGLGQYEFVGLGNFIRIFSSPEDRGALWATIRLAFFFVVIVSSIGLVLALALNRVLRWPGEALRSLFFVPAVMIPLAVTQVWRFILDYDGPLNQILSAAGLESWTRNWLGDFTFAPIAILLVMVWQYSGYAMIIIHAGLQLIPIDLYEAAAIDGATKVREFRFITLPLLAPSITVVMLLMTITGLRAFDQVLGLTGGGPVGSTHTLASRFYEVTWVYGEYGYGTSLALLLTGLVVVIGIMQLTVLRRREDRING